MHYGIPNCATPRYIMMSFDPWLSAESLIPKSNIRIVSLLKKDFNCFSHFYLRACGKDENICPLLRKKRLTLPGLYAKIPQEWNHSSAGRAHALQAWGHRFEPYWFHQKISEFPRFFVSKPKRGLAYHQRREPLYIIKHKVLVYHHGKAVYT